MPRKIEISHRTIVFTVGFLALLWFLYFIRDILSLFFAALLLMAILNPTVKVMTKRKIPRPLAVFAVYFLIIGIFALAVGGIVPALVEQTTNFAVGLPNYLTNIGVSSFVSQEIARELVSQLGNLPSQVVKLGASLISNIINIISVLIFAFYLLLAREKLGEQMANNFPGDRSKKLAGILDNLEKKLGGWVRGELSLMVLVGVLMFIGLSLLKIPFALPLAILAGVLELIPSLGPIVAAIPVAIIGFGISPVIGAASLALSFLVQQLENYLFVPKVMEKSVGVSPVITLLALAIGFKLAGIAGALFSVPVFIVIQVVLNAFLAEE
jgi:predicted PurR-regulated permease PerM